MTQPHPLDDLVARLEAAPSSKMAHEAAATIKRLKAGIEQIEQQAEKMAQGYCIEMLCAMDLGAEFPISKRQALQGGCHNANIK